MKIADSRVASVRTARLSLVLDDGMQHSFDLEGPIVGTVTIDEVEIDVSSFGQPGASTPGRRTVTVDLLGTLAPVQTLGKS